MSHIQDTMKRANRLVAGTLKAAAVTIEELARRTGLSTSALRKYRVGWRTPSPNVLGRLSREIRRQSKRLERLARDLETEAKKGGGNA